MVLSTAVAVAEDITMVSVAGSNYNATMHGFYLNLSSSELSIRTHDASLSEIVVLNSFQHTACNGATGAGVTFGMVVLGESSDTVLGYSKETHTSAANTHPMFTFQSVSGGSLTLRSSDTYRFLSVDAAVLNILKADATKTYVYTAGGIHDATSTTEGDVTTITQGLKAPGLRFSYDANGEKDSCVVIVGANGTNTNNLLSPHFENISVSNVIPEPATATLSLLALAGRAARRRRK